MASSLSLTDDPACVFVTTNLGPAATLADLACSAVTVTDLGGALLLEDKP